MNLDVAIVKKWEVSPPDIAVTKNDFFTEYKINDLRFAFFTKSFDSASELNLELKGYNVVLLNSIEAGNISIEGENLLAFHRIHSKLKRVNIQISQKALFLGAHFPAGGDIKADSAILKGVTQGINEDDANDTTKTTKKAYRAVRDQLVEAIEQEKPQKVINLLLQTIQMVQGSSLPAIQEPTERKEVKKLTDVNTLD